MSRLRAAWLPAVVVLLCVLPWLALIDVLPWGADATKWVGRASLHADWFAWVFERKHFVGYRPVTALSFVLDHLVTGYAAWGYRVTDLAANAGAMLALLGVWRAWTKDRSWIGLLPVVLVLAHPATEEVVPYSTRRSYLLATTFGLLSVVAHARALSAQGRRAVGWSLATAILTLLAVLSNEVAYVLPPVLLIHTLLLPPAQGLRRGLATLLPTVAACVGAVLARHAVLGVWGGGYHKLFFAIVNDGVPRWTELHAWDPLAILVACGRYTLVPQGITGAGPLLPYGWTRDALVLLLAAWLLWVGVARPLASWRRPERRLPLVLTAWWVGSLLIVVLSETWFWRQSHAILLPLGLLAGVAVADAVRDRSRWDVPGVLGAALLLLAAFPFGPLAGGAELGPQQVAIQGTRVVRQIQAALPEGPGMVWLAVPLPGSAAQVARLWADRIGEERKLRFVLFASQRSGEPARPKAALRDGVLELGPTYQPEQTAPAEATPHRWPLDAFARPGWPRTWTMAVDRDHVVVGEVPPARRPPRPVAPPPIVIPDEGEDDEEDEP